MAFGKLLLENCHFQVMHQAQEVKTPGRAAGGGAEGRTCLKNIPEYLPSSSTATSMQENGSGRVLQCPGNPELHPHLAWRRNWGLAGSSPRVFLGSEGWSWMSHTQVSVLEPSAGRELDPTLVLLSQGRFGFVRLASRTAPRNSAKTKQVQNPFETKKQTPPLKLNQINKTINQKKQQQKNQN